MAERTAIQGKALLLCAVAAVLGAAAGASWQRRAAQGGDAGSGSPTPRVPSASSGLIGRPDGGIVAAGLDPSAIVDVPRRMGAPSDIRSDSRNLFAFSKSREERERDAAARDAQERKDREDRINRDARAHAAAVLQAETDAVNARWKQEHPEPPQVTLRLLGKIGAPGSLMAVLASADGEVVTARVGETVERKFKLLSLDYDTATIGCADTLVARHPEWAKVRAVLRMGVR